MDKVFLARGWPTGRSDFDSILGVFSTKDLADAYIEKCKKHRDFCDGEGKTLQCCYSFVVVLVVLNPEEP